MTTCRSVLALGLIALAFVVPSASGQTRDDIAFFQDVGPAGANGAWVLSAGPPNAVVVFVHGWRDVGTGPYFLWLEHLAFGGTASIVPRYQSPAGGSPARTLPALRAGIAAGLDALHNPKVPLLVVGYDYGARLAFYYAANAQRWGLPAPFAVDSIFPTKAPAGLPALGPIPAATRVLLQVGADDTVAGGTAAADLWSGLAGHSAARKHYRLVRSTAALPAGHHAPLADNAASRAAFWPSLDTLIERAVSPG